MASLLTLDIVDGYVRPVVLVKDDITCLIDTGANIPVWTRGEERLKDAFDAEIIEGKKFVLSGFGKVAEKVDAYRVSDFSLEAEDGEKIVFKSMVIACTRRPAMVANLIFPATAFKLMNYTVRNVGGENPVVEIEHDREEYAISPVYSNLNAEVIERVYSFSNE